jgi:hypothetical protein
MHRDPKEATGPLVHLQTWPAPQREINFCFKCSRTFREIFSFSKQKNPEDLKHSCMLGLPLEFYKPMGFVLILRTNKTNQN